MTQESAARSLANRHAGTVSAWTVFSRIPQDLLKFFIIHTVIIDVRLTRCSIEVEANIHRHQYRKEPLRPASLGARLILAGRILLGHQRQRLIISPPERGMDLPSRGAAQALVETARGAVSGDVPQNVPTSIVALASPAVLSV
jgi:hypothetical protein